MLNRGKQMAIPTKLLTRPPLHQDYFLDDKNRIGHVLGWLQPKEKLICIIKYVPGEGFWIARESSVQYQRVLKSYSLDGQQDNLKFIANLEKKLVYHSKVFGADFLAVPISRIKRYFYPEKRLQEILNKTKLKNELEIKVKALAKLLKEHLNIPLENIGITGSILWKGQTTKSDIDMIIYGNSFAKKFNDDFPAIYEISPEIKPMPTSKAFRYARSMARKSGLPINLTKKYIARKRWLSVFGKTNLSFVFSPTKEELPTNYGAELFHALTPIELECTIADATFGYGYPSLYQITNCTILKGKDYDLPITRIFSFEGALTGFFETSDRVVVRGLLEKVLPQKEGKESFAQIMLGSKECAGDEFIIFADDYEEIVAKRK